jgi:hypothetical protein
MPASIGGFWAALHLTTERDDRFERVQEQGETRKFS